MSDFSIGNLAPIVDGLADIEAYEQAVPLELRCPLQTSYEICQAAAERFADELALRFLVTAAKDEPSRDLTYKQLLAQLHQTANAFYGLGIAPGDTISLLLPTVLESHGITWGAQAAGIVSPLNPLLEAGHLVEIMNATQAKVLVTLAPRLTEDEKTHWANLTALVSTVPSLTGIVAVTVPGYTLDRIAVPTVGSLPIYHYQHLIADRPADHLLSGRAIQGEDTAAYFHTGGTTGRPKIAQLTHRNIAVISQLIASITAYRGRPNLMSALPLFHIYGLIAAGIAQFVNGRSILLMTPEGFRNPNVLRYWWHHVGRLQIGAFSTVPTGLSALMEVPVGDADLSQLKDVGCGAAPLAKRLQLDFEKKFNVHVVNGYGMTETSCAISRQRAEAPGPQGSVGTRFPYSEVRIVELLDGGNTVVRECSPGEPGTLLVKGPHVFKGYLDVGDNANAWVDGDWFNTGDLAFIDAEGWITLTGRAKDLIIRGGHNIDPLLIEEPLGKHPAVADVIAIGQPDVYAGEIPVAFVRLKPGVNDVDEEKLLAYCSRTISERAAIPKRIEILDEMPVTAVGKFFKPALRSRATENVLKAAFDTATISAEITAKVDSVRGQLVTVSLSDPGQQQAATEILEQYAVAFEFS